MSEKLVWSAVPNQDLKQLSSVEIVNSHISQGSQSGVSMVRDLWWEGFTEEVSFEFGVKE